MRNLPAEGLPGFNSPGRPAPQGGGKVDDGALSS